MDLLICYIPIIVVMIYYYYNYFNGRSIDMTEGIIIAVIGVLGGILGVIGNNLFNFSHIKDNLNDKHTLQKAEEYHNLETKDIEETRKDIQEVKNDISDKISETRKNVEKTENLITKVSDTAGGISTDIKLLSKDFGHYKENIDRVSIHDRNLGDAVKTFQKHIQELGEVYKQKDLLAQKVAELESTIEKMQDNFTTQLTELQNENEILKNDLSSSNHSLTNLVNENETLKSKLQSYEKDIDQLQEQLNKYDNQIEIDKTDEFEI